MRSRGYRTHDILDDGGRRGWGGRGDEERGGRGRGLFQAGVINIFTYTYCHVLYLYILIFIYK
jgi:hypothetical protein